MLVDWSSAPNAYSMRAGASRQVVSGAQSTVVRIVTEPGTAFDGKPHRHPHEQWIVVTAGELSVEVGDEPYTLRTGDVVYVSGGIWHAATGVGPAGATYLEVSAPPRLPGSLVPSPMEFPS
jgi:quercetin dioxygenase-like cupin family protein